MGPSWCDRIVVGFTKTKLGQRKIKTPTELIVST